MDLLLYLSICIYLTNTMACCVVQIMQDVYNSSILLFTYLTLISMCAYMLHSHI